MRGKLQKEDPQYSGENSVMLLLRSNIFMVMKILFIELTRSCNITEKKLEKKQNITE